MKHTYLTALRTALIVMAIIYAVYSAFPEPSHAQTFDPYLYIGTLNEKSDLFTLSATWNGGAIASSSEIDPPLRTSGTLDWSLTYDSSDADLQNYVSTLDNGVYTLQLYKGEIGDSTLVKSELIPYTATSSGSFDISFPNTGHYFLAYAVTYPSGTYPLGTLNACHGEGCILPTHLITDFQRFVTAGKSETGPYGYPIPAAFALLPFTVGGDEPSASNILFIPGTMESRLYTKDAFGNEKMLWEPTHNADVAALAMDTTGHSVNAIYTRDIVDYLYSSTPLLRQAVAAVGKSSTILYGPFEEYLNSLVSKHVISQWKAYPYDWRYDVSDILQDGSLVGGADEEPHRAYLEDEIKDLASSSPTGQVTIIAHSNGGLLAKALAVDLEKKNEIDLLDKIILVGTPQLGTPSAIGNELHGDGQTRALGIVTAGDTVRETGVMLPGPYDLLPSEAYFSYVATPVVSFGADDTESPYRTAYGTPIESYDAFLKFATDASGIHSDADARDLSIPATMNGSYADKAHEIHQAIDGWIPPLSLSLISISAIGQPTISGYSYGVRDEKNCVLKLISLGCSSHYELTHEPTITNEGDDTVVSISAGANSGTSLYFDAAKYKKDSGTSIVHQSLLSATPIQDEISSLITDAGSSSPYLSATIPDYAIVPSVVVSTHSPVTVTATDSSGHITGITPIPGTDFPVITEDIPNSFVETLDDENYLYLPQSNDPYTFAVKGYGTGTTTIELGSVGKDGTITLLDSYADLPTTSRTSGSFSLQGTTLSSLSFDGAGDGSTMGIEPTSRLLSTASGSESASASETPVAAPSISGGVNHLRQPNFFAATTSPVHPTTLDLLYWQLLVKLLQLKLELMKLLLAHEKARA